MSDTLNLDEIEARAKAGQRLAEEARRAGWMSDLGSVYADVLALVARVRQLDAERNQLKADLWQRDHPRREPYPNHPGYRSTGDGPAPYFGGRE